MTDQSWALLMIFGGAMNFVFQYLLARFEDKVGGELAVRMATVRENFESRNIWALFFCFFGLLWFSQELLLA